jgi:hypothetical protein
MTSNEGSVLITSDMIFSYLVNNKTMLSFYLEDGTILTGTVLGRDEVFLMIMENTILRLIQIAKINYLQADLNFTIEDLPGQLSALKPNISPAVYGSINGGAVNGGSVNGGALTGTETASVSALNPEKQSTKEHFKTRLDQLVRKL